MRNSTAAPLMAAAALLLLLLLAALPAAAATWTVSGREVSYRERSEEEARLVFAAWKAEHGKAYGSAGEEERRYAIFREELRAVDQHDAAGEAGVDVARIGLNGLADLTAEEWNAMCCGRLGDVPAAGGRKERGGQSTVSKRRPYLLPLIKNGIHYLMHLHRAYQAAVASVWRWCSGELGGESRKAARRAGEAARWEQESPRGMAAS